jgi:hypothetical protein
MFNILAHSTKKPLSKAGTNKPTAEHKKGKDGNAKK